jgi:DNA primase
MAGRISQSTLDKIRVASDIIEVIGGYFPLKKAGGNYVALCPFHNEKSPSFNVNPQRQIYHCFGCNAGGDVFKFLQEYEHLEFVEAVRRLAERAGIVFEFEQNPQAEKTRNQKNRLLHVHAELAKRWHDVLINEDIGQPARDYLKSRGITRGAAELFQLGFAPESWEDTVNWARAKSFDLDLMEESGLVANRDGKRYGRFRGRLMFPINDEQGRVIGFSGRVLEAEVKAAKYVNSPETVLFHKSRVFYGLDKARREILDAESALVCEGQLDTMACYMAGLKNVVAPQGTALTAEHARILKRYTSEVVLCFDSDTAGQEAAVRSFDSLLESELAVRVMKVPAPHDPDSYIREQGVDAFRDLMNKAPGFFDFYLSHLLSEHNVQQERGQREVVKAMGLAVRKTKDAVLLDGCAQQTALAVGASAESVRVEFQRITVPKPANARPTSTSETGQVVQTEPPSQQERWLLRLAFYDQAFSDWTADCLDLRWVKHSQVRAILERAAQTGASVEILVNDLDADSSRLLTGVLAEASEIPDPSRQLKDLVTRMRDQYLDLKLAALTRLMAQPNLPEEELMRALEEQRELQGQKHELLPLVPARESS